MRDGTERRHLRRISPLAWMQQALGRGSSGAVAKRGPEPRWLRVPPGMAMLICGVYGATELSLGRALSPGAVSREAGYASPAGGAGGGRGPR